MTTAARSIAPEPLPLIEDDRDETRLRLDSLDRLLERAPLGGHGPDHQRPAGSRRGR